MVDHYSVWAQRYPYGVHVTFDLERGGHDLDMVCLVCIEYIKVTSKLGQVSAKRSFKLRSWCSYTIGLPHMSILSSFPQLVEIPTERYHN